MGRGSVCNRGCRHGSRAPIPHRHISRPFTPEDIKDGEEAQNEESGEDEPKISQSVSPTFFLYLKGVFLPLQHAKRNNSATKRRIADPTAQEISQIRKSSQPKDPSHEIDHDQQRREPGVEAMLAPPAEEHR
jgi:hypothetical protein